MRVLLIKTSSMGDIIHTFPALTDAGKAISNLSFDWMVEDTFAGMPKWHPLVQNVIPVSLRRWRKGLLARETRVELKALRNRLRNESYDLILDAQSLVKSSILTFFAKGLRAGLDFKSAREGLASFAYQRKYRVNFYQHAVVRMRNLFSQALQYELPTTLPEFGLNREHFKQENASENYLVFLHGTTWATKQWPENYWIALSRLAARAGFRIKISGGNAEEVARAERIAKLGDAIDLLPYLSIPDMGKLLIGAKGAVAVDTGFGHLAAALDVPTLSLYSSTNPDYTGALGKTSLHLAADFACSPCLDRVCKYKKITPETPACFETIPPHKVWEGIQQMLNQTDKTLDL